MDRSDDIRNLPALKASVEDQVYSAFDGAAALDQGVVTRHPARFPAQYRSPRAALARTQQTWAYRLVTSQVNFARSNRPQNAIHRPTAFQGVRRPKTEAFADASSGCPLRHHRFRMTPAIFEGRAS